MQNLEFNVELKDRSDYEFALQRFNALWEESVEVSEELVEAIEKESPFAEFTSNELYLKFLYEYFKRELNQFHKLQDQWLPAGFKNLRYQSDAVLTAKRILEEYGGVFLSDVVGLGKTYMSALLARELDGRALVLWMRGEKVILDRDLARLYGVETKALKQAVRRNIDRFPDDFMFELTENEIDTLQNSRSQFVTLKQGRNIKYTCSLNRKPTAQ